MTDVIPPRLQGLTEKELKDLEVYWIRVRREFDARHRLGQGGWMGDLAEDARIEIELIGAALAQLEGGGG